MFQPPLTIINQDPRKMGQQAISLLLDVIENKISGRPDDIIIKEEFLWKESILRKEENNK
jgi:DNA-binding LacI/PurR family transcriptional regulator